MKLPAIILAAGRSSRMKSVKALLTFQGKSLIENCLLALQTNDFSLHLILGHHKKLIEEHLDGLGLPVSLMTHPDPDQDQISSIRIGINSLPENAPGFLLFPVDHGFVSTETIEMLREEIDKDPNRIVVPSYKMRRGHPTWFPKDCFHSLLSPDLARSARDVLRAYPRIYHLELDDQETVSDLDTPRDFQEFERRRGSKLAKDW